MEVAEPRPGSGVASGALAWVRSVADIVAVAGSVAEGGAGAGERAGIGW